ncbi:MAG: hypothetical protein IJ229_14685 [Clostridia bacterium]|nr:hypothetical protein [Clostridia bacterium]
MYWSLDKDRFVLYASEVPGQSPLPVLSAYAKATADGTVLDSRLAEKVEEERQGSDLVLTFVFPEYLLKETLTAQDEYATAQLTLQSRDGKQVTTNDLTPLVAGSTGDASPYVWRDLRSKMLLVPYDNDMWIRYEAIALHAGIRSADVTVLFEEDLEQAILIGAMDFALWKNAIACPGTDARILEARCGNGAVGEDTHDCLPHGSVTDVQVTSSRFTVMYGEDWRALLEQYASLLCAERAPRRSAYTVPFGFNCYAGLGRDCNKTTFRSSGEFLSDELMPRDFAGPDENGERTTFVNLDGGWEFLVGKEESLKIRDEIHARGQKAGIYDAPFACFERDLNKPLRFFPEHTYGEIVMRKPDGSFMPRVDGAIPYDLSHPVWEAWIRKKFQMYVDWGYDYLKIDFLSHGGMEGVHSDPSIRTGREMLDRAYRMIDDILSEERIGRPFFLSLSIAPLFPYGFGNARRFSCDAFGLTEDVEYVLNALDYSWWTNGKLYQYNDPDHIVLLRSFCMLRDSTEGEARARYTSSVIAGPMLLLSDDYRREEARERTKKIAGNARVNALAREGLAFRQLKGEDHIYAAVSEHAISLAIFSLRERPETVTLNLRPHGLPEGDWEDLWSGETVHATDGVLTWHAGGTDALLLRISL